MEKETEAELRLFIKTFRKSLSKLVNEPTAIVIDEYALNEAGWKFVDMYSALYKQEIPDVLYTRCKVILRFVIAKYLECEGKDPNEK
jgi:hypothetical protein